MDMSREVGSRPERTWPASGRSERQGRGDKFQGAGATKRSDFNRGAASDRTDSPDSASSGGCKIADRRRSDVWRGERSAGARRDDGVARRGFGVSGSVQSEAGAHFGAERRLRGKIHESQVVKKKSYPKESSSFQFLRTIFTSNRG